jgi:ubiquinone/menaquinone biosynthesis C-methylase UbiE
MAFKSRVQVTAFDISSTAINECHQRFPESSVQYIEADLFNVPSHWKLAFDIVQESYTLQVLPPNLRTQAISCICQLVAVGGHILFVARARDEVDPPGQMPWPLTKHEVNEFLSNGFEQITFNDYLDTEDPPVRRFSACFQKIQT